MKISIIKRCFWVELETIGKILGWTGIIGSVLLFLFAAVVLTLLSLMPCMELCEILKDDEFQDVIPEVSISDCKIFKAFVMFASILVLVFSIILTVIDTLLLIGIQKRDPGKIIPAVVIQGIATFTIVFRGLASFSIEGIIIAVVLGCFAYLIFIILYSLYVKIRNSRTHDYENQIIQICKS